MTMLTAAGRYARLGALLLLPVISAPAVCVTPAAAQIAIGVSVNVPPPVLPVYVQPPLPGPGYLWTPGFWAWNPDEADYYWVPGAWVQPPRVGYLWTPGYWGWVNGAYVFRGGYWGPTVGFYGGVNYGFGYTGAGFFGGQWRGGQYFYNSSVNNVRNVSVTNVYNKAVVVNNNVTRTSFNGGPNGLAARPTPGQLAAANQPHVAATPAQAQLVNTAKADPQARFSANQGKPANAVLDKPVGEGGVHPGEGPKVEGQQTGAAHEPQRVEPENAGAGARFEQPHAAFDRPHPGGAGAPRPARLMAMPRPAPHPGGGAPCHGPRCG